MAKVEWGIKRSCQKCHTKYYDMQKEPITCPKCGTGFQHEILKIRDDLKADLEVEDLLPEQAIEGDDHDDFETDDLDEAVDIKEHNADENHL